MHRFRIGVLTSGGDCPGLNAVIRATVTSAHTLGWEVLGFIDGYEGLLSPVNYKILTLENTEGITSKGGTIIGTTNKGRFVAKSGHGEKAQIRMMIGVLLPKADPQSEDAADALAIAVTHAHHRQSVMIRVAAR